MACPLRLIPRDNPPHQAGRPTAGLRGGFPPRILTLSRRAQEGRGRATAVPLVQSPPAGRAGATPRDPLFAVRSVRAQGRMSVGKGQAKPFYTRKRPVRCSDAADQPSSGRLLLSSRQVSPSPSRVLPRYASCAKNVRPLGRRWALQRTAIIERPQIKQRLLDLSLIHISEPTRPY